MLFRKNKKSWMDYLNEEDRLILLDLINSTKKYRYAYSQAENPKIAQLWTALIELKKQMNEFTVKPTKTRKTVDMGRMVKDILKPVDDTSDEATRKLVESLMKF